MIRIYNGLVMTMCEDTAVTRDEVWVDGSEIIYVGPSREDAPIFEQEIDLQGNLLLPGFKDAHTHSAMTFLRSFADDLPLEQWLNEQVFPMEAKLTADDIYWLTRLAILEYLTSGITASFDMYFQPDAYVKANIEMGFRTVLCGSLNDYGGTVEQLEADYLRFNNCHPLVSYQLGFHAEYTTSKELLEGVAKLAHKLKAPVYMHNSETKKEVEGCKERYGMTPTQLLNKLGMFEYGGGGFHCVHMDEEDLRITKEKGLYVISNPASNAKLASGIAPIQAMVERGIPVALGTDGPASNNCLDMFREMFLVTALQKLALEDASALSATEVLKMACVEGANAMGLADCNCIAAGKKADLILLDLQQPNMQPLNAIDKNIVYSGSKQNVIMTMIDGKILYRNGQFFAGCDCEEIYRKANQIIERMTTK